MSIDIPELRLFFNENRELFLIALGLLGGLLEGGRRHRNRKRKEREAAAQICPSPQQPEQSKEQ